MLLNVFRVILWILVPYLSFTGADVPYPQAFYSNAQQDPSGTAALIYGYHKYYQCIIECHRQAYGFQQGRGDLCTSTAYLGPNTFAYAPIQSLVNALRCVLLTCRSVIPDAVCSASTGGGNNKDPASYNGNQSQHNYQVTPAPETTTQYSTTDSPSSTTDSSTCATDSSTCATDSSTCATDSSASTTDSSTCATDSSTCATGSSASTTDSPTSTTECPSSTTDSSSCSSDSSTPDLSSSVSTGSSTYSTYSSVSTDSSTESYTTTTSSPSDVSSISNSPYFKSGYGTNSNNSNKPFYQIFNKQGNRNNFLHQYYLNQLQRMRNTQQSTNQYGDYSLSNKSVSGTDNQKLNYQNYQNTNYNQNTDDSGSGQNKVPQNPSNLNNSNSFNLQNFNTQNQKNNVYNGSRMWPYNQYSQQQQPSSLLNNQQQMYNKGIQRNSNAGTLFQTYSTNKGGNQGDALNNANSGVTPVSSTQRYPYQGLLYNRGTQANSVRYNNGYPVSNPNGFFYNRFYNNGQKPVISSAQRYPADYQSTSDNSYGYNVQSQKMSAGQTQNSLGTPTGKTITENQAGYQGNSAVNQNTLQTFPSSYQRSNNGYNAQTNIQGQQNNLNMAAILAGLNYKYSNQNTQNVNQASVQQNRANYPGTLGNFNGPTYTQGQQFSGISGNPGQTQNNIKNPNSGANSAVVSQYQAAPQDGGFANARNNPNYNFFP